MYIDIPPRPEIGPTDLLCINRKIHDSPIKPRQSVFVDRFMQGATVAGCPGHLVSYHEAKQYPTTNPWHIRGMKFTAAINDCWRDSRTFYYTDNGYVGNGQQKVFFRIIENHVHDIRSIIERPRDRLSASPFPVVLKNFTPGRKLLIAPPSEKFLCLWGINPEVWVAGVV
jgi:hypothetical protein